MATRSCPTCGTQYVATVRRCIDCGATLVDDETSVTAPEAKSTTLTGDRGQVGYELPGWGNQLKVALEGMLDNEGVPRVWEATVLSVPAEFEETVDGLIATLEGREVAEPDEDAPQVALEIEGLDQDTVDLLEARLLAAEIAHLWSEDGELVVAEADEAAVLELLDAVFEEIAEEPADGVDVQGVLSELYVVLDRLVKRPADAKLAAALGDAAEPVLSMGVPYGFEAAAWRELTGSLEGLVSMVGLRSEDGPVAGAGSRSDVVDEAGVVDEADALRGRLREIV